MNAEIPSRLRNLIAWPQPGSPADKVQVERTDLRDLLDDHHATVLAKERLEDEAQELKEQAEQLEDRLAQKDGSLSLRTLRRASTARLPLFKNAKGAPANTMPDGSDWSLNDWFTALAGEVGELGNILKKIRRGDYDLEQVRGEIGKELADILIYLDILAARCGVELDAATAAKFNEASRRVGCAVFIAIASDDVRAHDPGKDIG